MATSVVTTYQPKSCPGIGAEASVPRPRTQKASEIPARLCHKWVCDASSSSIPLGQATTTLLATFQRGQIVDEGIQILERELLVKTATIQRALHQSRWKTFYYHGVWFDNGLTDVVRILANSNIPQARPEKLFRAIEFMTRDTAPLLYQLLPRRARRARSGSRPTWSRPARLPPRHAISESASGH